MSILLMPCRIGPVDVPNRDTMLEERADRPPVETVTVVSASRTRWR
jgi:hypothetical protein